MARRLNAKRLILVMAALVLGLGAASVWVMMQGEKPAPQPSADERALRQVREQRGATFDVRYAEPGRGRAVCGYAGPRNGVNAVAFVSRPNRILFSDDPLPVEFREVQQRFCPGFLATPDRSGVRP
jgi:hypothetical protein